MIPPVRGPRPWGDDRGLGMTISVRREPGVTARASSSPFRPSLARPAAPSLTVRAAPGAHCVTRLACIPFPDCPPLTPSFILSLVSSGSSVFSPRPPLSPPLHHSAAPPWLSDSCLALIAVVRHSHCPICTTAFPASYSLLAPSRSLLWLRAALCCCVILLLFERAVKWAGARCPRHGCALGLTSRFQIYQPGRISGSIYR